MANMVLSRRARGNAGHPPSCHDHCDGNMSPHQIKEQRRKVKRSENRNWKREIRTEQ
jgi:hypothetical protein